MTSIELLICAVLILISAFMAAAEIALFSLSRFQLRAVKERLPVAHRKIKRLLSDPGGLLISILVINEIVNISLSTLITKAVSRGDGTHFFESIGLHLPEWAVHTLLGTLVTAPLVLFFCEVTPKVTAARVNQVIAPLSAGPLNLLYDAMFPFRLILRRLLILVSKGLGTAGHGVGHGFDSGGSASEPLLREEDFLHMVEEGHKEGAIHESEMELIRNVLELDDTQVSEIFTPLSRVYSLPATTTLKTALTAMRSHRFSRVPVTGANRKDIVGLLYSKDLLLARLEPDYEKLTIESLARKPFTVSHTLRLNALFRKLKQHRTHIAIVERKPGEAMGIVTMNDVLDALFEDMMEEKEAP